MCIITYSQFFPRLWGLSVPRQRPSRLAFTVIVVSILAIIFSVAAVLVQSQNGTSTWEWLDVVYVLGYVKLLCTLTKYAPQAYLNYRRKSTSGWSIWQILLDVAGGILSLLQLVIDSALQADWSGLYGNPAKLALSNFSLFFDTIFITQHYV
jgi:cystinosin